jgi:hypothetical protein
VPKDINGLVVLEVGGLCWCWGGMKEMEAGGSDYGCQIRVALYVRQAQPHPQQYALGADKHGVGLRFAIR